MVTAIELDLVQQIELLPSTAHPVNRDPRIVASNPLGKVPTLITDQGMALYDSHVICEYLDSLTSPPGIFPPIGDSRWVALRDQSLADGMLDAALLVRYENAIRPEGSRSQPWIEGQMDKITKSLQFIEMFAPASAARVDIGTISFACALGYLDFRFEHVEWQRSCPRAAAWFEEFSLRDSMQKTRPQVAATR
jgi:glutathione S-transferase